MSLNHIDTLKAAPIHVAIRKRQYQALLDCTRLNRQHARQVIDLNVRDKRGQTPLHYAIDKQDYEMFMTLLSDPFIDPCAPDSDFMKARRGTVIFSAFNKMLYAREKIRMRRQFEADLQTEYVDF